MRWSPGVEAEAEEQALLGEAAAVVPLVGEVVEEAPDLEGFRGPEGFPKEEAAVPRYGEVL